MPELGFKSLIISVNPRIITYLHTNKVFKVCTFFCSLLQSVFPTTEGALEVKYAHSPIKFQNPLHAQQKN